MLEKVLTFIQYKTSWLAILGLLVAAGLLMFLMNGTGLPFSNPTIEEHSGGVAILDMRMSYTPEEAYHLFTALGTVGRQAYRTLHLVPDMLFPIGYALAFAFASAWFLVRLLPLDHPLQWLSLTPLISGLADVLENLSLVISSLAYPSRIDWLVQVASLLTKIKFGLMPVGVVFLCAMVVVWLIRKRPTSNVTGAI
ncbi:MAG: hypothetical protein PVH41_01900 [Anaerolineae bacterium]|jgi:hypothetical protein